MGRAGKECHNNFVKKKEATGVFHRSLAPEEVMPETNRASFAC